jgi:hypothetical protein
MYSLPISLALLAMPCPCLARAGISYRNDRLVTFFGDSKITRAPQASFRVRSQNAMIAWCKNGIIDLGDSSSREAPFSREDTPR